MKNLIIYSLLLFCVVSVKAQEVTQLEETTVTFKSIGFDVVSNLDNYSFIVKENHAGEFSKNRSFRMAKKVGLKEAFLEFPADSAVPNRNGKIIKKKATDYQLF